MHLAGRQQRAMNSEGEGTCCFSHLASNVEEIARGALALCVYSAGAGVRGAAEAGRTFLITGRSKVHQAGAYCLLALPVLSLSYP